jgi:hypothetical protein
LQSGKKEEEKKRKNQTSDQSIKTDILLFSFQSFLPWHSKKLRVVTQVEKDAASCSKTYLY